MAVVSLTPPAEADVRCLPPGNTCSASGMHFSIEK